MTNLNQSELTLSVDEGRSDFLEGDKRKIEEFRRFVTSQDEPHFRLMTSQVFEVLSSMSFRFRLVTSSISGRYNELKLLRALDCEELKRSSYKNQYKRINVSFQ